MGSYTYGCVPVTLALPTVTSMEVELSSNTNMNLLEEDMSSWISSTARNVCGIVRFRKFERRTVVCVYFDGAIEWACRCLWWTTAVTETV